MRITCLLLVCGLGACAIGSCSAKSSATMENGKPLYRCAFTSVAPTIDGKIDDDAWKTAAWTQDFVDVTDGAKPPLRTRVRLLWDDKYLYIAAELEETNVHGIRTEHDDKLFLENVFEVFIDPDNDTKNYAEFEINALNTTFDATLDRPYRDHGTLNLDWTAEGWKTAVHVDGTINDDSDQDKGWTVEMAIPWSALKELAPEAVPPKNGTRWSVELARVNTVPGAAEGENRGHWVWSPIGEINFHRPDKWGVVEFVR